EVDLRGRLRGAGGVAGELVLVAVPGVALDRGADAGAGELDELARSPLDAAAERRGAPVVGRGEQRRWHRDGAQEGEQRAQVLVDDHRVAVGAGGGGEDHRGGDEQI